MAPGMRCRTGLHPCSAKSRNRWPADSKPTLDMFTKNIGFTPNMTATFALSPIAFNSWATLLGSLSKALDVKTP